MRIPTLPPIANRPERGVWSLCEKLEWVEPGTKTGARLEIQAKVSSVVQLFRSASRPFHPFFTQPLYGASSF
jgi:hypothetical protein